MIVHAGDSRRQNTDIRVHSRDLAGNEDLVIRRMRFHQNLTPNVGGD